MKRIVLVVSLLYWSSLCFSQERKGYFAFTAGTNSLSDFDYGFKTGIGLSFSVFNLGYTPRGKGLGFNVASNFGVHRYKNTYLFNQTYRIDNRHTLIYGTMMAGPMYTFKWSEKSRLEIKARAGFFQWQDHQLSQTDGPFGFSEFTAKKIGLGYSMGTGYQRMLSSRSALLFAIDYHVGPKGTFFSSTDKLKTVNVMCGVALYFKQEDKSVD
jgi:hypothetical protein